jgi:hypothetical protein
MKNHIFLIILMFSILSIFLVHSADGFISVKKHKVINSPKVCGDKLCSKIDITKTKRGESSNEIKICGYKQCNEIKYRYGNKPQGENSSLLQSKLGIALDEIKCMSNLELVIKTSNNTPVCLSPKNASKLIERGWALRIDPKPILEFSKSIPEANLGTPPSTLEASLSITQEIIDGKRFLIFNGFNWRGFHNVEITISGDEGVIDSIRSKTSENGDLYLPWVLPDSLVGGLYSIYATDQLHDFEIKIPMTGLKQ